jgi:hypothetical protein
MMADATPSGSSLGERLKDTRLIERALARAVRKALLRHKQAGNPIAVWQDGRVVWIAPEDIPVEPES